MYKKIISALACTIFILFSPELNAQLGKNFNDEMNAIVKAGVPELKGKEKEKQQGATIYQVKLNLAGFELTYAETSFGNDLHANYRQTGSMETMDSIYARLMEKNFTLADSKLDPKILGRGIFASDLKRKITVKSIAPAQWRANITMDIADKIMIVFIKE